MPPNLKVQVNSGYFDLVTPFYEGIYEMRHLAIPEKLQSNIEYRYYESGHMVISMKHPLGPYMTTSRALSSTTLASGWARSARENASAARFGSSCTALRISRNAASCWS